MKHTPGKWKLVGDQIVTDADLNYYTIAKICCPTDNSPFHATARLIAAAPELLEASKYALKSLQGNNYEMGNKTVSIEKLKNAIANAEGR